MDAIVFDLLEMNRKRTLEVLAGVAEAQADVVPSGFNNNIRWHAGHILTTQERLSLRLAGEPMKLPEELMSLFLNGTKPADWQEAPPSLPELTRHLEEQPGRIRERLQGKLGEPLAVAFKDFRRLDEALIFSLTHEALHAGYIMALKKASAAQV